MSSESNCKTVVKNILYGLVLAIPQYLNEILIHLNLVVCLSLKSYLIKKKLTISLMRLVASWTQLMTSYPPASSSSGV